MSIEAKHGKNGLVEDMGTHTRERTRRGAYWRGRTDVVTIKPKDQNPDAPHYVVMPGYTANGNSKVAEAIAVRLALGTGGVVDVFTVSGFLRGRSLSEQTQQDFPNEPKKTNVRETGRSTLEVNPAALLLRYLKESDITNVRLIAHSLGIQSTAIAMELDTEGRIADAAGVASAGVNEKRPVDNIMIRFGVDTVREAWDGRKNKEATMAMARLGLAGLTMLIKHPIRFAWHEIRAAKYGNVAKDVVDSSTDIRFLAGSADAVFGDREFSQNVELQEKKTRYDGGHNRIYTDSGFVKQQVIPLFK